jgi:hypothetical protein
MQKIARIISFPILFFLSACHSNELKNASINSETENKQSFFPVTAFILGQLNELESMPITPLKISKTNGKQDSLWLKKENIRSFASPFLRPVIDSVSMEKFFVEKSFLDQTINAITLSYDLKAKAPDSIKLTHWDVYIDPQKGTVERIYLVKEEMIGGANVTSQLTWKVNESCSIRQIFQEQKMAPVIKEALIKWDFDH